MMRAIRRLAAALCVVAAGLLAGCSNSGGPNDNNGNDNVPNQPSAGAMAFAANGCAACHPSQATDFHDSSVDAIVDTLLDEQPHPGGAFGELTDQEIEDITDFLLAVMNGNEDLDDGNDNDNNNGNDNDDNDNGNGESQAHAWFEHVWNDFDQNYSHFAAKGVDWNALHNQYEPQFEADLSTEQFVPALATMLAELRDLHVWLFDAGGTAVEVYARPATPNYPNFYPDGVVQWQSYPLWHGWVGDQVAFLSIELFDGEKWSGLRTGEVDSLFATKSLSE